MAKQAELTGMEGNRKLQDLHDAALERPRRTAPAASQFIAKPVSRSSGSQLRARSITQLDWTTTMTDAELLVTQAGTTNAPFKAALPGRWRTGKNTVPHFVPYLRRKPSQTVVEERVHGSLPLAREINTIANNRTRY